MSENLSSLGMKGANEYLLGSTPTLPCRKIQNSSRVFTTGRKMLSLRWKLQWTFNHGEVGLFTAEQRPAPFNSHFSSAATLGATLSLTLLLWESRLSTQSPSRSQTEVETFV